MIKEKFIGSTFYFPKTDKRNPVTLSNELEAETVKRLKELVPYVFEEASEVIEAKPETVKPKQRRKRK